MIGHFVNPGKRVDLNNPLGLRIKSDCFGVQYDFAHWD